MLKLNESNLSIKKGGLFKPVLFKFLFKQSLTIIITFMLLSFLYSLIVPIIVAKFVSISGIDKKELFIKIFGMLYPMQGILFTLLLILFVSRKICAMVNNGDLAYIFCSRTSREQIVFTQFLMLLGLIVINFALQIILPVCFSLFKVEELWVFIQVFTVSLFLVTFSLFFSCLLNKQSHFFAIVGGTMILFFIFNILAYFGDQLKDLGTEWMVYFKYFTVLTFLKCFFKGIDYNPDNRIPLSINNDLAFILVNVGIVLISIGILIATFIVFKKKDLLI